MPQQKSMMDECYPYIKKNPHIGFEEFVKISGIKLPDNDKGRKCFQNLKYSTMKKIKSRVKKSIRKNNGNIPMVDIAIGILNKTPDIGFEAFISKSGLKKLNKQKWWQLKHYAKKKIESQKTGIPYYRSSSNGNGNGNGVASRKKTTSCEILAEIPMGKDSKSFKDGVIFGIQTLVNTRRVSGICVAETHYPDEIILEIRERIR